MQVTYRVTKTDGSRTTFVAQADTAAACDAMIESVADEFGYWGWVAEGGDTSTKARAASPASIFDVLTGTAGKGGGPAHVMAPGVHVVRPMTPHQVLAHMSPAERDTAIRSFLSIELQDCAGMARHDRDSVQLAVYSALHHQLMAAARESAERDQAQAAVNEAARAVAVRISYRSIGTGGMHTFRGRDCAAVVERARASLQAISSYRSPSMSLPRRDEATGEHVVSIRFYGLD
ncbi:hypothetical protein [Cupriavidus sp. CuC1]|uniref:hypothetical protein n=1 Tax=Cupriavidus sp. CuC1 TaxID=3373131 RepID=UPI0037CF75CE